MLVLGMTGGVGVGMFAGLGGGGGGGPRVEMTGWERDDGRSTSGEDLSTSPDVLLELIGTLSRKPDGVGDNASSGCAAECIER